MGRVVKKRQKGLTKLPQPRPHMALEQECEEGYVGKTTSLWATALSPLPEELKPAL